MENRILDIIRRNLPKADFLTDYERHTFEKVLNCRTVHPVYQSCKNRMCPVCNGAGTVKWIAAREDELLPCCYFLLTYTVPAELGCKRFPKRTGRPFGRCELTNAIT